jgi:Rrf2 family iron-sulfur cluster assembly transcriptional regulator
LQREGGNVKISTKGRYGLRAITDIAVHGETEAVSLQSIARRQKISERYLEQLMASLKKAGLVVSIRGAQGGYRLAKDAGDISVGDVLRALEGSLEAVVCADNQGDGSCIGADRCVTRVVWKQINDGIRKAVDTLMLSQLVEESKKVQQQGQCSISICESQE